MCNVQFTYSYHQCLSRGRRGLGRVFFIESERDERKERYRVEIRRIERRVWRCASPSI
jgi:hypothetical protein